MAENLNTENEYDRLEETEAEAEAEESTDQPLVQPAAPAEAGTDLVLARVNRAPYYRAGRQYSVGEELTVPRYVLEQQNANPPHLVAADAE